jgi:hypothetical protein
LGMKEGNGAIGRALTVFRNISNPPADPPPTPPSTTDTPPEPGP